MGWVQSWALGLILICLIALPTFLAIRGNNAGATTIALACGLAAVLVFIPQVHSFEFGPLKAEMRAKIEEANATLQQLRGLASDLARVSVLSVVEQGGLGGPSYQTLYTIRTDLETQLTSLDAGEKEIHDILEPLSPRIQTAFGIQIQSSMLGTLDGRSDRNKVWKSGYECTSVALTKNSVDEFRKCGQALTMSSPDIDRMLDEMAEFQRTGHVARLDAERSSSR